MSWKITTNQKIIVFSIISLSSLHSATAFWDTAARKVEEAARAAAMAGAIADVLSQIQPDTTAEKRLRHLQKENERLSSSLAGLSYLEADTKSFLNGPDFSSPSLESNLRAASEYIQRGNSLVAQAMILGTDGVAAVNGIYTNLALGEIQKNQAVMISQNERSELLQAAREIEDTTIWQNFISRQKVLRQSLYRTRTDNEGMK